jgi:hypothetical protein
VHDAARQPLGQLHPPHHVPGEDSERQSVLTAIHDVDELVLGLEREHRRNRAEDLLCERPVLGSYVRENRWPVEEAVVRASRGQPSTCIDRCRHQLMDVVPLMLVDDRSECDVANARIAHGQPFGRRR